MSPNSTITYLFVFVALVMVLVRMGSLERALRKIAYGFALGRSEMKTIAKRALGDNTEDLMGDKTDDL